MEIEVGLKFTLQLDFQSQHSLCRSIFKNTVNRDACCRRTTTANLILAVRPGRMCTAHLYAVPKDRRLIYYPLKVDATCTRSTYLKKNVVQKFYKMSGNSAILGLRDMVQNTWSGALFSICSPKCFGNPIHPLYYPFMVVGFLVDLSLSFQILLQWPASWLNPFMAHIHFRNVQRTWHDFQILFSRFGRASSRTERVLLYQQSHVLESLWFRDIVWKSWWINPFCLWLQFRAWNS